MFLAPWSRPEPLDEKKTSAEVGAAREKNQEPEPLEKSQKPEPLKNLPAPQPCKTPQKNVDEGCETPKNIFFGSCIF